MMDERESYGASGARIGESMGIPRHMKTSDISDKAVRQIVASGEITLRLKAAMLSGDTEELERLYRLCGWWGELGKNEARVRQWVAEGMPGA